MKLKDDNNYLQNNFDLEMTKWSLESVGLVSLGTRLGCLRDDLPEDHPARQLIKCAKDIMELAYKLEFYPSPWKYISTPNFKKMMKTLDLQWVLSSKYIEQAKKQINERGHVIPEEEKSVIEKLLAIDEKVAIMMANEMLMAGIDTVGVKLYSFVKNYAT
uniref:Cytochrome P450 37 n=1 Tax=Streltzoviella insularis TaxID=1206366 RepID=A0A7D5YS65_9NEOP|nr:cytochrome P450 37 [Streltzoviella insularis]